MLRLRDQKLRIDENDVDFLGLQRLRARGRMRVGDKVGEETKPNGDEDGVEKERGSVK